MLEFWIPITIAAAFLQNMRSALQKHLKGRLTTLGAAYVRFSHSWPFSVFYVWALYQWGDMAIPDPNGMFLLYSVLGGISQIIFTVLLLWLFSFHNFTVGTTFSKTEIIQVALLGFLILGDTLTIGAGIAIFVAVAGVMVMSAAQSKITVGTLLSSLTEKPTLIGLACGAFLGMSVVFFRGSALALGYDGIVMAAAFTLAVSVVIQTVIMGIYIAIKEPKTLVDIFVHWRWTIATGLAGTLTSIGWFTAFTMQNGAYVRALGQIELVFTFVASVFFFREKTNKTEVIGILLVIAAILILILGR
jgi:drug/metabolite transporter (DMT)-like permease